MKLFVVATPIGNLEDLSQRALEILKAVDFIACENPRYTLRLLGRYDIKTPIKPLSEIEKFITKNDIALVSDAGTPGISDPGSEIINNLKDQAEIIPIPGPSAVITALSISGFPASCFKFLGFIPHKKKRNKYLEEIINRKETVVFYESPHRIIKTLKQLPADLEVCVCRELTKLHETIYRGEIKDIINKIKVKGEFVVVVRK